MRSNSYSNLILVLLVVLVNMPKIDIFSVPGMKQGIRIDDLIVLIIVFLSFSLKSKTLFASKGILLLLGYILFSTALGVLLHPGENFIRIAYIFRVIEYFAFAIALRNLCQYIKLIPFFKITLAIQFVAVISGLLTGNARSSGTLSGPWEVVTVVSLISFFTLYATGGSIVKHYSIPILISIFTKSRTAILGVLISLFFSNKNVLKLFPIFFLVISSFFYYVFELAGDDEFFWLKSAFNLGNLDLFVAFVNSAWENKDVNLFQTYKGSSDPSLAMRLGIWFNLIALYSESNWFVMKFLFGIGLGSKSIVVDGFYIRLVFELGMIGVFLYFRLMKNLWRRQGLRPIVIYLAFTCLTLDPYSASKIAYTLGIMYAYSHNRKVST
ncbi:membrane protein of unknown function [Shewanella benthica]|uniref:Polysaccharide polymerase n=1 Tax=Shewanella benthica TaxID=43661 RepID=A0A330M440_9GAMM|nr:hypothetical protein [Shewanella benthica]SQH77489.1 membrane protein of unknown function [Shewanella benthica]